MAASNTWRSHDALLMELTGWLFNHEVISATFSALWGGQRTWRFDPKLGINLKKNYLLKMQFFVSTILSILSVT